MLMVVLPGLTAGARNAAAGGSLVFDGGPFFYGKIF